MFYLFSIDKMEKKEIKDFLDSHLWKKLEIITETGSFIAKLLKEQNDDTEQYKIKVVHGDITDVDVENGEEIIDLNKIQEVKKAA